MRKLIARTCRFTAILCKKTLSLVLVLAMLASFAGMTGFSTGIVAQALSFGGGANFKMATTVYKYTGTSHTMKYTLQYVNGVAQTADVPSTEYGIPASLDANDYGMSFTFSKVPTSFDVRCSLTNYTNETDWNTAVGYSFNSNDCASQFADLNYTRDETTVMQDEYGSLYKHYLKDKGVGGYRDISKVYWRFKYIVDGTTYTEYVTVDVIDHAQKDNVNAQTWTVPAASRTGVTGKKPTGSYAATNKMQITVPSTLYKDATGWIIGTLDGAVLNNSVDVRFPVTATHVAMDVGTDPDFSAGTYWTVFNDPASSLESFKVGDYYVWNNDTAKLSNADFLNNNALLVDPEKTNTTKKVTGSAVYYRFTYRVMDGDRQIEYTQYAASYVRTAPVAFKTAWFADTRRICNSHGSNSLVLCMYNLMDFSKVLAARGTYVETSLRSDDGSLEGTTSVKTSGKTYDKWTLSSHTIGFSWDPSGAQQGHWLSGKDGGATPSYEIPGAVIHYDPQVATTLSFDLTFNQYKSPDSDHSDTNYGKDVTARAHNLQEYSEGWNEKTKFDGKSYYNDSTAWEGDKVSDLAKISYYHTDSTDYTEDDMADKGITVEGDWSKFGVYGTSEVREATGTRKYTIDTSEWSSAAAYLQLVTGYTSRFDHTNGTCVNCTNNSLRQACGWFIDLIPASRTNAHAFIDQAINNNYVQAEMDADWWEDYKDTLFDAYISLGNLNGDDDIEESVSSIIDKPTYVFADYSKLQKEIMTLDGELEAEDGELFGWDRGGPTDAWILANDSSADTNSNGKIDETERKNAGYLNWGDNYAKYNQTTYNSGVTGRSPRAGAVANSLAAYDLKFINKQLFISDEIRTGEYYYSSASWAAYEDARFRAMNAYNYPAKAAKTASHYAGRQTSTTPVEYTHDYDTVKFDYNAAYPQKAAGVNADNGVGLACYCKAEIDAATLALAAARSALVKKEDANEYDELGNAYTYLVEAASAAAYDGEYKLHLYQETDVRGNIQNPKHGFVGIYNATSGKHNYQTASLYFRANDPADVFDYVWTEEEAKEYNEGKPLSEQISSGTVHMQNGVPMYKYEDGTITTAEAAGDTGILSFPKEDGSRGPVGRGNTFPQLYFDNSTASNKAVENMRTALTNRLNWGKGGYNPYYPFLRMVQGAYQGDIDGEDEDHNTVQLMTEKDLIDAPQNWTWNEVEHRDDILRAAYALLLVAPTVRLATNYREVEEILNNRDNDNKSDGEAFVPAYDIGGSMYIEKSLQDVEIFHDFGSDYDSGVVTTYDGVTYNTSGKTWYTAETWEPFATTRDELAKLIFNGKNTGGQAGLITEVYDTEEINQPFAYKNQLAKTHYTYDVYYESSNQPIISGQNTTNKFYTNGHYYNQIASNYEDNLAVNGQAEVNRLVDAYKAAMQALELKKLNVYVSDDFPTTSADGRVENIVDQVEELYGKMIKTQTFYDFVPTKVDGKITGATVDTGKTMYYYNEKSAAYIEAEAQADILLAVAAYNSTDNLADKVASFDSALTAFKTNYDSVVSAGQNVDTSSWDDIIAHMSTLAGRPASNPITHGQLTTELGNLYTDVEIEKPVVDEDGNEVKDENGETVTEKTKVSTEILAAIAIFDNRDTVDEDGKPLYENKQDAVNTAVKMLYDTLNREAPSYKVVEAADDAIEFVTQDDAQHQNMFNIYNYTSTARAGTSIYRSIFTDESIDVLKNGTFDEAGNQLTYGAVYYQTKTYPMLSTYFDVVNDAKDYVEKLTGIAGTNEGGVLVKMKADTQYLELAVAYAKSQLYSDVAAETVKSTQAINPTTGETVDVPNFTANSIAELEATIELAEAAIAAKYGYENQLEIDKITYAIFEETEDSANYFFSMNAIGMWEEPYIWVTDEDGKLVKTNLWGTTEDDKYTQALYGERLKDTYVGAAGYGLQDGPAYLDFLEAELSTPFTDKDGNRVDNVTPVWGADGWLILDNGAVPGTSLIFGESWGTYKTRYEEALVIWNKYKDGTVYDVSKQNEINTAAENLYKARIALEFKQNYFPNNKEDYEQACLWFKEIEAYALTTPINRYGKVWVDVYDTEDPTKLIGRTLEDSDDPSAVAVENVYLYTGVDAELVASITQYQAKYASPTSTEPFEVNGAHEQAYLQIKGELETRGCGIKPANHDDFKAGLNDLDANYIAGDWDGTTYTKNKLVLSNEQSAVLQEKLAFAQACLTDADATSILGLNISGRTDDIHTYTITTEAKDMEFVTLMRGYLIEFMQLKYTSTAPAFYDGGKTREFYIFDQSQVNGTYIPEIDAFCNNPTYTNTALTSGYPTIYEVNNLVLDVPTPATKAISVTTYTNGLKGTQTPTTDVDKKIAEIFTKIGPNSSYYKDVFEYTNNYYTAPLEWIMNNAFATGPNGEKLILADLDEATSLSSKETVTDMQLGMDENQNWQTVEVSYGDENEKVAINWYSEGYDYYTNEADGRAYYLYESTDNDIYGSGNGSWFDDTQWATLEAFINGAATNNGTNLNSYLFKVNKVTNINSLSSINKIAKNSSDSTTLNALKSGWKYALNAQLQNLIKNAQANLNTAATNYYTNIRNLKLLPATEAYREVEETYQAAMAKTVTWGNTIDTAHFIALSTSGDTLADLKKEINGNEVTVARFYNNTPAFLEGLGEANYTVINNGEYYSPSLPGQYDKNSTKWTDLENFHTSFADTTNMITIDKAALVTAVDLSDADGYIVKDTDSPMEKLIKYLYALELTSYDFAELNEFVSAFLGNPSTDADTAMNTLTTKYYEKYNFTGRYYNAKFYTEDSLKAVYDLLLNNGLGVITSNVYNNAVLNGYVMDTTFNQDTHGGGFYDEPVYNANDIGNPSIAAYTQAIADKIKALVLAAADKTELDPVIEEALDIIDHQTEIYVRDDDQWDAFIKKLYAGADGTGTRENPAQGTALYVQKMCDINVDGYYTEAEHQGNVNTVTNELLTAIGNLNKNADKTAPKMTVLTGKDELEAFYTKPTKVTPDAQYTNADYLKDAEAGATPAAATLLMANNGYSLLVYTNQLNPRIVITLQDIADIIDAAKGESIEIAAVRTSGVDANLIYGSMNAAGAITEISKKIPVTAGSGFGGYTNETEADGSSVFAILAPTFDGTSGKETQQARYTIKAYDKASLTDALNAHDNFVNKLYLGGEDAEGTTVTVSDSKEITIHIHYHNSMSADNDEGIKVDANGKLVETTPAAEKVNRVPGVYFDGELTYDGYWRAGVVLQRRFSSMVRNWEFVSEVKNNQISGCAVSGYNDPNFGVLNTGSFYYVLDKTADADVYEQYFDKNNKKTEKGIIDYAAATVAKQTMLKNMDEAKLTAMRESGRFFDYGQDILWSQALNNKIADGDLVFVHVVDRWGNVVNRIIEVPNFDNVAPNAVSPSAGIVNIEENGGAGIANINIWNGWKFEEMVAADYEVVDSQTQKLTLKDGATATVSCTGNVLTISGLTPGGGYSIDVYDNAGNVKIVTTRASGADENGKGSIQIKITDVANGIVDDTVSDGEEGSVIQQSAMFTLNGTDTVILNTGMESSIINADVKGNVLANQTVMHTITTKDTVTQIKSVRADGQTEEWTKKNSFVTDNGDGTLTWIIPRKFAEGEHVYKVYAMVDGKYETFSAPCSITATTKTVVLTVKNAGPGRTVIAYSGAIEQKNSTFKSYVIPYGAEVKITAETTKAGSEFYYWFSNVNNRILSTADVYSFTAVSNVNCSAQFTSDEMLNNNKKLVVYVNNAKNVIKAFDLADGEEYTVPAGPILPDYTFKGWNMTPAEVYASDKDVVVVEPVYELNASYTVTILEGNYTTTGAGTYTSENNKRPTVTISASKFDDDGAEFLYWFDVDTNEMVSFNRTYSFHCVKDTVLVPVYGDASTINPAPIVRLTAVKYSALNGKVSFFAERSVPEEFIIHKTGIVVTRTESIGTNEEVFVVGGTATTAGESTNTVNNGFYSANVDIVTGQTVWARAYAICEDESGEIFEVYGPITSYTLK